MFSFLAEAVQYQLASLDVNDGSGSQRQCGTVLRLEHLSTLQIRFKVSASTGDRLQSSSCLSCGCF